MTQSVTPAAPLHHGVGLHWLLTGRWVTAAMVLGAGIMGVAVLDVPVQWGVVVLATAVTAGTNLLTTRRLQREGQATDVPGWLVVLDTVGLGAALAASGGPLNPVSIYFLVLITAAALVHGPRLATVVAVLATALYGLLFLMLSGPASAALAMHPEMASHFQGMWWAFALTAALVTIYVTRLATAVAERERDLRSLEARLARTETITRLAALVADTAHELATPLGTIALTAGELERYVATDPDDLEPVHEDARLIREEAHRCRTLLDDLAARAGEPAGSTLRLITIGDIVNEAVRGLPHARQQAIDVSGDTAAEGRWAFDALARALLNVLRNALDASPDDAHVRVTCRADADAVVVQIDDTGHGMAADVLAQAAEPFYTTRVGQGRGLGLFVVRQTLELMGGRLTVTSEPGAGTHVELRVPRGLPA